MTGSLGSYLRYIFSKIPGSVPLLLCNTEHQFADYAENSLVQAIQKIEDGRKHYQNLDEEGLTFTLVMVLRTAGIAAKNEEYHGGHVDITISHFYLGDYLGECKIYKGPKYHSDGCGQLLSRYSTGRFPRGFCLAYVFDPKIKDLMDKVRNYMDINLPYGQVGQSTNSTHTWSFRTSHLHKSGSTVDVVHLGCNLNV